MGLFSADSYIGNILGTLADLVSDVVQFFITIYRDLVYITSLIREIPSFLSSFLNVFPIPVITLFSLTLTIVILYKVVGREG